MRSDSHEWREKRFACDLGGDVTYSSLCRGWDGRVNFNWGGGSPAPRNGRG